MLILLSDGVDNASHVTFDAVIDLIRRLDVNIYTITLKGGVVGTAKALASPEMLQAAYAMRALATEAGGRAFFPTAAIELPSIYQAISNELAFQYVLGYVPMRPPDGQFRRVSIRVLPPAARRPAVAGVAGGRSPASIRVRTTSARCSGRGRWGPACARSADPDRLGRVPPSGALRRRARSTRIHGGGLRWRPERRRGRRSSARVVDHCDARVEERQSLVVSRAGGPDGEWTTNAGTTSISCCSPRSIVQRRSAAPRWPGATRKNIGHI